MDVIKLPLHEINIFKFNENILDNRHFFHLYFCSLSLLLYLICIDDVSDLPGTLVQIFFASLKTILYFLKLLLNSKGFLGVFLERHSGCLSRVAKMIWPPLISSQLKWWIKWINLWSKLEEFPPKFYKLNSFSAQYTDRHILWIPETFLLPQILIICRFFSLHFFTLV